MSSGLLPPPLSTSHSLLKACSSCPELKPPQSLSRQQPGAAAPPHLAASPPRCSGWARHLVAVQEMGLHLVSRSSAGPSMPGARFLGPSALLGQAGPQSVFHTSFPNPVSYAVLVILIKHLSLSAPLLFDRGNLK